MSSAAKLRKFGRGTAAIAMTATVMTAFGPVAFAAWDAPNQGGSVTSQPDPAVGIVDTDQKTAKTQGATLVQAGKEAQTLDDLRLVLPNSFQRGDVIDLRIFDRSATEANNGRGNSGPSTKMEFSADPSVGVTGPAASDTVVGAEGRANADAAPIATTNKNETETAGTNPWKAATGATGLAAQKPGVSPDFEVSRVASTGSSYKDTIRLKVTSDPSTGDPNARWVVQVKDLKVDLGATVTPGELRIVPFAYNGQTDKLIAASALFGNIEAQAYLNNSNRAPSRQIRVYTVAGYVSPVTFDAGSPNIAAEAGVQSIGDLLIKETNGASLTSGAYTVHVSGATIANKNTSDVKATLTDGGSNETVEVTSVSADSFTFSLANADTSKLSTIKVAGLMLNGDAPGKLEFRLTGGSVDQWLADAGKSQAVMNGATQVVAGSPEFVGSGIDAAVDANLPTAGLSAPAALQHSGTLNNGQYKVAQEADGTYRLLVGDTPVATSGNGTTFVLLSPFDTNITFAFDRQLVAGEIVDVTGGTTSSAQATASTAVTPAGFPSALVGDDLDIRRGNDGLLRAYHGTIVVAESANGAAFTAVDSSGVSFTLTNARHGDSIEVTSTSAGTVTAAGLGTADAAPAVANGSLLPSGAYTVQERLSASSPTSKVETFLVDADGQVVGKADTAGAVFTLSAPLSGRVTFASKRVDGQPVTVGHAATTAAVAAVPLADAPAVRVSGSQPLGDGVYEVNRVANGWTITGPDPATTIVARSAATDGRVFTLEGTQNGETLSGFVILGQQLPSGSTFEVESTTTPGSINQLDIVGPRDKLVQVGTVSAGTSAIGGADRFGTARKIAKAYSAEGDHAIVVNGMNFPDALSSGFLSQRLGAPILLTGSNFVPQDTLESLKERGVQKVFIVGGSAAVGKHVVDTLRGQDAYMWDAGKLKPRGSKLEVLQLGGQDRYHTNWVVNTYTAAQTANAAPVGKINVKYGQPMKTTAMVARGDAFPDALTANLLTAGLPSGRVTIGATAGTAAMTTPTSGARLSTADVARLAAGTYSIAVNGSTWELRLGATAVATLGNGAGPLPTATPIANNTAIDGAEALTFDKQPASGDAFTVTKTAADPGRYTYSQVRGNALPVILTPKSGFSQWAANEIDALHIEHVLLIGGTEVLPDAVKTGIETTHKASTYRLAGSDRFDTARVVNEFAMASSTPKASDPDFVPGLGFDGGLVYNADGTIYRGIAGAEAQSEWVAYLANGLRYPDALVAGPWISASRDSMLMTTGTDLTDPSRKFLTDNAAKVDRAAALGLGNAVAGSVISEANKLAASK